MRWEKGEGWGRQWEEKCQRREEKESTKDWSGRENKDENLRKKTF